MVKAWPIVLAAVSAMLLAGGVTGAKPAPVRIGVVLKDLDNPFFVAMYEGVRAEAGRRGAHTSVRAAKSETDLQGQAARLRALVAAKAGCYVVNPISRTNLIPPLRGVRRPIVNIDSPVDLAAARRAAVHINSFIGTNDVTAGTLAGSKMASLLGRRGTVALLGGTAGSINSIHRLTGFMHGIQGTNIKVVAQVNAGYVRTTAEVAARRILRTHPHLSGFYAANDLMALGIADAVRSLSKPEPVKIIGVDGIAEALDAVRSGSLSATVSQYPYVMGRMAVEACVAAVRGARLPANVDSPVALVSKSNVARATASFPRPFRSYSDPFASILRRRR